MLSFLNWNKINDGLPTDADDGRFCVVLDPTNEPQVWPAKWHAENKNFESNGGWFEPDEITHWAFLQVPEINGEIPKE